MKEYTRLLGEDGEVAGLVEIKDLNKWHRMYFVEGGMVYTAVVDLIWTPESIGKAKTEARSLEKSVCHASRDELTRRFGRNFAGALLEPNGDFYPEAGDKYKDYHLHSDAALLERV